MRVSDLRIESVLYHSFLQELLYEILIDWVAIL